MTDLLLEEIVGSPLFFDLKIGNGDLVLGDATKQHQELLLLTEKGENREFSTRGVGLRHLLLEEVADGTILSAIKREFERDGMSIKTLKKNGYKLLIDANYD